MVKGRLSSSSLLLLGLLSLALLLASCGGSGGGTTTQPTSFTLTVTLSGTGSGTVTGTNISCGDDCTESYAQGTSVTLNATAASGSTFAAWGGSCSGATCTVTMDGNKTVTATFNQGSGGPGPGPSPGPGPGPGPEVVSGTIQDWTGEAMVLQVRILPYEVSVPPAVLEAPISADGTFSLTLPDASAMEPYLGPRGSYPCSDSNEESENGSVVGTGPGITFTPSPLRWLYLVFLDVYANSTDEYPIGSLEYGTDSVTVSPYFAASNSTVTGYCDYTYTRELPDGTTETEVRTVTFNLNLQAGWNNVLLEITETESNVNLTYSTGDVPAGATWTLR